MSRVALVVPPFFSARFGSLACGTLKAVLVRAGIDCDVHYLNLALARRIGPQFYQELVTSSPEDGLLAEWVFSRLLSPPRRNAARDAALSRALERLERRDASAAKRYRVLLKEAAGFVEEALDSVDWEAYAVVGFSSGFYCQMASLVLSRELKRRRPGLLVALGGDNVEGPAARACLETFPWLDAVCEGEGEEAVVALARNALEGRRLPVPGLWQRGLPPPPALKPADVASLPMPDYDDYFAALEREGLSRIIEPLLHFEGSRGCWWGERRHCLFCGALGPDPAFRAKSPERLADELLSLSRRYRVTDLYGADNILDDRAVEALAKRLAQAKEEQGVSLNLFFELKANMTPGRLALLKKAGVNSAQPGFESFDDQTLRLLLKGTTAAQNLQTLRTGAELEIDLVWNLLHGVPGEPEDALRRTLDLLASITHLQPPDAVLRWELFRFSPYFKDGPAHGVRKLGPAPDYAWLYPPGAPLEDIAYRYRYELERPCAPQADVDALKAFALAWKTRWRGRTFLRYAAGPGFVRVYDHRLPSAKSAEPEFRRLLLEGLDAKLLLACRGARGPVELSRGLGAPESEVRAALSRLQDSRLVYGDGARFVALAVPLPSQPDRFLETVQMLQALHNAEESVILTGSLLNYKVI